MQGAETRERSPSDEDVLAAVAALSLAYRSPTSDLIASRLAGGRAHGADFRREVSAALERLRRRRRLVCVTHRGSRRWAVPPAPEAARR